MDRFSVTGLVVLLTISVNAWAFSDFAAEVVSFQGNYSAAGLYDDPNAILGKPAVRCLNDPAFPFITEPEFRVKLAEAAYYLSIQHEPVLATINPDEWIVVKFDHKVMDYPNNPYGQDLIVFGNSMFEYNNIEYVSDATDLNTLILSAGGIFDEVLVSVSQDGQNWHSFDPVTGPWADDLYPTHAYHWDRQAAQWTDDEMDFTRPIDPNLSLADFDGLTAADAIELYDGSGGGTPFGLQNLPDFNDLAIDPDTGYRWIQYVRLEGGQGMFALGGQVDAVSDVAVCGDPTHPYPVGDINLDCRVNLLDYVILSSQWLAEDCASCGGADLNDPPDQAVTFDDLVILVENWLQCTYKCQ